MVYSVGKGSPIHPPLLKPGQSTHPSSKEAKAMFSLRVIPEGTKTASFQCGQIPKGSIKKIKLDSAIFYISKKDEVSYNRKPIINNQSHACDGS